MRLTRACIGSALTSEAKAVEVSWPRRWGSASGCEFAAETAGEGGGADSEEVVSECSA
jgi:hypothetical protein